MLVKNRPLLFDKNIYTEHNTNKTIFDFSTHSPLSFPNNFQSFKFLITNISPLSPEKNLRTSLVQLLSPVFSRINRCRKMTHFKIITERYSRHFPFFTFYGVLRYFFLNVDHDMMAEM